MPQKQTVQKGSSDTSAAKAAIEESLRETADKLAEVADSPWTDGFAEAVRSLYERLGQIHGHLALEALRERRSEARPLTVGQAIASNIKLVREWSGWTQQEIADAMKRLGFVTWQRITVAEAESGKRKLSIEELMGYGILFGVEAAASLAVPWDTYIDVALNERISLDNEAAYQLLTSRTVYPDEPISRYTVGAQIVGADDEDVEDWRPIANPRDRGRPSR